MGSRWSVESQRLIHAARRRARLDAGTFRPARGRALDESWIPSGLSPYGVDRATRSGVDSLYSVPETGSCDVFRRRVQRWQAVQDSSECDLSVEDRARRLVRVAACGTPVFISSPEDFSSILPNEVVSALVTGSPTDFDEAERLLAIAFTQWSAIFDHLVLQPGWAGSGEPAVSITISTHRPAFVKRWVNQIARQTHRNLEVICVLHSDEFTTGQRDEIRSVLEAAGIPVSFSEAPAGSSLGMALDTARRRASGDVILKWDDDDLYSSNHVRDLLRARHYSQAPLVGKACDFVYVGSRDMLVQRHQADRESFSPTLSGNTLMIDRDALDAVGGWSDVSRGEDVSLIARVHHEGGMTYRTMGFGMIAVRHTLASQHTWDLNESALLKDSVGSWPGLHVAAALVDADPDLINEVRRFARGER